MNISTAHFSCAGPHHSNEDSVVERRFSDETTLFAVADGIGGHSYGEIASSLATEKLCHLVAQRPEWDFQKIFDHIRMELIEYSKSCLEGESIGTTLSACLLTNTTVIVGHVGDSRVYHLRGQGLLNRTKDQTEVQKLLDEGVLTKASAKRYRRKHVLLSALSTGSDFELYTDEFDVQKGDRLILCTDGVYNLIPRQKIRDISVASASVKDLCAAIKNEIELLGATDDYSAIAVEFS